MKSPKNFFWFRRDLRLNNNAALYHALKSEHNVQCVFIFDKNILDALDNKKDARVLFIHQQLTEINETLQKSGSSLLVSYDTPIEAWKKWIKEFSILNVFTNNDYEPYALERDEKIEKLFNQNKIAFQTFKDHVIFEKNEITKEDGSPYTVFTPYKNKWLKTLTKKELYTFPTENNFQNLNKISPVPIPKLEAIGFQNFEFAFPPREVNSTLLKEYPAHRDFPAVKGTSHLSVHLRFGTVSIRDLAQKAQKANSETWLNELIWRDFYQMILWHFPHSAKSAFKPAYDRIPWRNNETEFQLWCEGKTGYPIVDAGMRELNATGFMHNRVRMITASFLTKHLLIDWRWGEAYFAEKLIDFDLASNNGGWQWAAGSGCDAAPYFRIFSPYEQTKKFDPEFKYIRKWVPEFEDFSYPKPILDHKFARERCLKVYKKTLQVS